MTETAELTRTVEGRKVPAPGTYVIRRQRERSGMTRRASDFPRAGNSVRYVAD